MAGLVGSGSAEFSSPPTVPSGEVECVYACVCVCVCVCVCACVCSECWLFLHTQPSPYGIELQVTMEGLVQDNGWL